MANDDGSGDYRPVVGTTYFRSSGRPTLLLPVVQQVVWHYLIRSTLFTARQYGPNEGLTLNGYNTLTICARKKDV